MKTRRIRIPFIVIAAVPALYYIALKAAEPVGLAFIRPGYFLNASLVWILLAFALLIPAFPESRIAKTAGRMARVGNRRRIAFLAAAAIIAAVSAVFAVRIMTPAAGTIRYAKTGVLESGSMPPDSASPEYLIVLGGGLLPDGRISAVLRSRLDAAAAYSKLRRNVRIIVSGGQGKDEPIPESAAMAKYLAERTGIPSGMILADSDSKDTIGNLANSRAIILRDAGPAAKSAPSVAILTSDYHLNRALHLAREAGFPGARGIAAACPALQFPNALLREVGSWWKLGARETLLKPTGKKLFIE